MKTFNLIKEGEVQRLEKSNGLFPTYAVFVKGQRYLVKDFSLYPLSRSVKVGDRVKVFNEENGKSFVGLSVFKDLDIFESFHEGRRVWYFLGVIYTLFIVVLGYFQEGVFSLLGAVENDILIILMVFVIFLLGFLVSGILSALLAILVTKLKRKIKKVGI
ncbi:MAG: hypothetical protein ACK5N8_08305 [Alphaproteobacteria bacterium]